MPSTTLKEEAEQLAISSSLSGEYVGHVNTVGDCGFSFVDCSTNNILLLNKSGYHWVVGNYHTIRVSSLSPSCGYTVTYKGSGGLCQNPDQK
ncbi:hypothetical protein AB9P05_11880 [Roseivirga sp. BDSF3-8]|uniref:hypothetical protein n=1 Tax=Roseivirga sp. BDSF3-8 TaxID=3241598 RepID=UPI003531E5D3